MLAQGKIQPFTLKNELKASYAKDIGISPFGRGTNKRESPIPFTNPYCWLRSDMGILKVGNAISHWADMSSNGWVFGQTSLGARPSFTIESDGLPSIVFDGTNDQLILTDFPSSTTLSQQLRSGWNFTHKHSHTIMCVQKYDGSVSKLHASVFTTNNSTSSSAGANLFIDNRTASSITGVLDHLISSGVSTLIDNRSGNNFLTSDIYQCIRYSYRHEASSGTFSRTSFISVNEGSEKSDTGSGTDGIGQYSTGVIARMGSDGSALRFYQGSIREIIIWDRYLNSDETGDFYHYKKKYYNL